jgi:hypothetical protein
VPKEGHCSGAFCDALLEAIASHPTDQEEMSPADYNPLAGRLFISFKRFLYLFDIGATHGRELLKGLDPPVRHSGRRVLIPVSTILRLAENFPIGFGREPESARRGREARRLGGPTPDRVQPPADTETDVRDERVPSSGNLLGVPEHNPPPLRQPDGGSHRSRPHRRCKKSAERGDAS